MVDGKMTDKPGEDTLDDEPFEFQATKNGLVQISYGGRVVTNLAGRNAERFLQKVEEGDARTRQLLMAKATGHFKHGNERLSKQTK